MTLLDEAIERAFERQRAAWAAWKARSQADGDADTREVFRRRSETMALMREREELLAKGREASN